jgi:hypothetical protein
MANDSATNLITKPLIKVGGKHLNRAGRARFTNQAIENILLVHSSPDRVTGPAGDQCASKEFSKTGAT